MKVTNSRELGRGKNYFSKVADLYISRKGIHALIA